MGEEMGEDTEIKKVGLLEDGQGNFSSMRLAFVLALINSIAMSWFVLLRGDPTGVGLYLVALFLIAAFGGKGLQSFAESMKKN
jgi:hypothetical protein